MTATRDAYVEKIKARLDEWNGEIDRLQARADAAKADLQVTYTQQIDMLRRRQRDAEAKLKQLREAADDAWAELKPGLEDAWKTFREAMAKTDSELK
ncbi:MAG TPA: hypothetical protein VND92_05725 [Vicinamibacterales bacterium]|nr:hypothetical protein [Vicinamibacterales bacterium]